MTSGIYGYYDTHKKYVCYIGKDSNINDSSYNRHTAHCSPSRYNEQQINRVLQNNPNRYDYFILAEGKFSDDELNDMERQAIEIFKTFKYDYPERSVFNFTKGGEGMNGCEHSQEWKNMMSKKMSGKNNPSFGTSDSGISHVFKSKSNRYTQGYRWAYQKKINGKRYEKKSVNLRNLEKNVLKDNQEWIILNEEKAKQSYQESDKNNKR